MNSGEPVRVECHSGYRFGQRPVAVWFEGKRWDITDVVREWRSTGRKPGEEIRHHFRVRIADGQQVELIYNQLADTWWLQRVADGK